MEIEISLWEPHAGQQKIQDNIRRFNVIVCGRRFGKTEFCAVVYYPLIAPAVFEGKKVGVFVADFKDFSETWDLIVDTYKTVDDGGIIEHKDETKKRMKFLGGGIMEVWSIGHEGSKEKGRGRKYHRVIYEEAQKIPDKVLEHHFKKVTRALLMDYKGDCFFIMTANGKGGYLYKLCQRGSKNAGCERNYLGDEDLPEANGNPNWYTHRMTSYENPYLDVAEIEEMKNDLDPISFHQEVGCVFVDYDGTNWVYVLGDYALQRKVYQKSRPINLTTQEYFISFDFNKIPMTALVMKKVALKPEVVQQSRYRYGIHIVKEFKTNVNTEASIYDTCQLIREWVLEETGRKIGKWGETRLPCTIPFLVTGDASGERADGRQKVPLTYYDIIQDELQIAKPSFIIPKANPLHAESYVQTNTIIAHCPEFVIYEDKCPGLIVDIGRIKSNASRQIIKGQGEEKQADLLDNLRYLLNTFCKDIKI